MSHHIMSYTLCQDYPYNQFTFIQKKKKLNTLYITQTNLQTLNNQHSSLMIINLHLYTKLGHPVYGQGRAIFEKEESHRHEGDEKRGKKGGVTKRSVTEVIRVVQVARTKGPFYYRVPLSSHGRFENSSVSRVAIIFSLLFPLPSSI